MKLLNTQSIITGGASGIGLATAQMFIAEGSSVYIVGRDTKKLAQAKSMLNDDVETICADVSSVNEITSIFDEFEKNSVDVLVVNAAIAKPLPFEYVSEENFDATVNINVKGTFFTIQKALPYLKHNSKVVVITSITNQMGSPNFSVYAATKAALRSLVKTLGLELIDKGIRINAVSPGPIETPMYNKFDIEDTMIEGIKEQITQKSPSKRFGTVEETAKSILFLATDESSYIVGEELVIDGGMSLL
jgi:NAD(P)-dependent dehydrogenase (short-subunit alcohol dehydrogenase family)